MSRTNQMLRLALRNVQRNWRHSLATILAIAAGFTAVCLFDGFIADIAFQNEDGYSKRGMLGHVLVQRHDAQFKLAEEPFHYSLSAEEQRFVEDFLAHESGVLGRVRFLDVKGIVTNGRNSAVFMGMGYDVKDGVRLRGSRWEWNTVAGKPLHLAPELSVTLGGGMGRKMECESQFKGSVYRRDGGYIAEERPFTCHRLRLQLTASTESAQINAIDLQVAGLVDAGFREADQHYVSMPLEVAQKLLDTDRVSLIAIHLRDPSQRAAFLAHLRGAAQAAGLNLDIMPWQEHVVGLTLKGAFEILHVFRNLFMSVVAVIGVMSITNTMMKSVNERVREIGTLRSMGFRRKDMLVMFAAEGFLLSAVACVLGLALTLVATWSVSNAGFSYKAGILSAPIPLKIANAPLTWVLSGLFLSVLATFTAWICARRAAHMIVAEALRHT